MTGGASRQVVIVGAGPAGIAAADALVAQGLRPILFDEGSRAGGQGYRRSDPALGLSLGYAAEPGYRRIHAMFDKLKEAVDYRPETLVWSVDGAFAYTAHRGAASEAGIAYDALILATGATDRVAPVPGWTLPGVYTLGGAQVLLKDQGCAIGREVVFYGSSPLLYLAAVQYLEAGAGRVTILDTTAFSEKVKASGGIAKAPAVLWQGLSLMARLRRAGVTMHHGVEAMAVAGDERVEAVTFRAGGRERRIACDAVAIGHGLRAETQLAELAGCDLAFDLDFAQWLPKTDADGRAAAGLYLAGDGARIGGAVAAELAGRIAALACLADFGHAVAPGELATLRRKRDALHAAQRALSRAFSWSSAGVAALPDETVLCRCESVTAGAVRRVARGMTGGGDINRVKALTRCGMGRCQSRMCGQAAIEIAAAARGEQAEALTHFRPQPPVKPIFIPSPTRREM